MQTKEDIQMKLQEQINEVRDTQEDKTRADIGAAAMVQIQLLGVMIDIRDTLRTINRSLLIK